MAAPPDEKSTTYPGALVPLEVIYTQRDAVARFAGSLDAYKYKLRSGDNNQGIYSLVGAYHRKKPTRLVPVVVPQAGPRVDQDDEWG